MSLKIKNWQKFQHYGVRRPIWIKLYRDLLDDPEWVKLDPTAAKVLVMLWMLASETNGDLPCLSKIAFRLRMTETSIKTAISKLSHWLYQDASNTLAPRYQDARAELDKELDKELEKNNNNIHQNLPIPKPDELDEQLWQDFLALRKQKKAPMTYTALHGIQREAKLASYSLTKALQTCCARGWQGFHHDWVGREDYVPDMEGENDDETRV